jgi:hypothetical protein
MVGSIGLQLRAGQRGETMSAVWMVNGPWTIHQAPSTTIKVNLKQDVTDAGLWQAGILGGTAHSSGVDQPSLDSDNLVGAVIDNRFYLLITWGNGTASEYHGTFGLNADSPPPPPDDPHPPPVLPSRLWGVTCDLSNLSNVAAWVSDPGFKAPVISGP